MKDNAFTAIYVIFFCGVVLLVALVLMATVTR